MQAVNKGSLMRSRVIDQIVNFKRITGNSDNRAELWVDLPVAVVIVDVQKFNGGVDVFVPSLKADQQFLDPGVESGIVEHWNQIFNDELVPDDSVYLFLIPFFIVDVVVLLILFGDLLVDQGVVVHWCFVVVEAGEPHMSLTHKFVHEEGGEVDVQVSVWFKAQLDVVFWYLYHALVQHVTVHILQYLHPENVFLIDILNLVFLG